MVNSVLNYNTQRGYPAVIRITALMLDSPWLAINQFHSLTPMSLIACSR